MTDARLAAPAPPPEADLAGLRFGADLFVDQYRELGPVFRVPLPDRPFVVVAGPEGNLFAARHGDRLLSSEEAWRDFMAELGYPSSTRDGERNLVRRRLQARTYARGAVSGRVPELVALTREVTDGWRAGDRLPLLLGLQRIVGEQLGRLLVDHSPGPVLDHFVTFLHMAITSTLVRTRPASDLALPEYLAAKERSLEMARAILAEHRARPRAGAPDSVDRMLAAVEERPDEFGEGDLLYSALTPLLAGLETVATHLAFLVYAILRDPELAARVVADAGVFFARGELTWARLRDREALYGAMMESLRAYPMPLVQRYRAAEPFVLEGRQVERGEEVYLVPSVAGWLPELFCDPGRFDADRYRPPRNEHRRPGAFAPFGLGDHTCLGSGIAEVQIMAVAATILHDVELEPADPAYVYGAEDPMGQDGGTGFEVVVRARRG